MLAPRQSADDLAARFESGILIETQGSTLRSNRSILPPQNPVPGVEMTTAVRPKPNIA